MKQCCIVSSSVIQRLCGETYKHTKRRVEMCLETSATFLYAPSNHEQFHPSANKWGNISIRGGKKRLTRILRHRSHYHWKRNPQSTTTAKQNMSDNTSAMTGWQSRREERMLKSNINQALPKLQGQCPPVILLTIINKVCMFLSVRMNCASHFNLTDFCVPCIKNLGKAEIAAIGILAINQLITVSDKKKF